MTGLARCVVCQDRPVAWRHPRVDYCYHCLPGGPFTPPPCRHCGSRVDYFTGGLCEKCHPDGPKLIGHCRERLAWGVFRQRNWSCWNCNWWRSHYPLGACRFCRRQVPVNEHGACRLCWEQGRRLQTPGRAIDLIAANRYGQQLFLANHHFRRPKTQPAAEGLRALGQRPRAVPWRQLTLFSLAADPELIKQRALHADPDVVDYCKGVVLEHSVKHGWSRRQTNDVIRSLRLLHLIQDTPRSPVTVTEVLRLRRLDGNIRSTLDVLDAAGLLIDDRPSNIELYFTGKTAGLPEPITRQLQTWLDIRVNGSTTVPRSLPRLPQTVRIQIAHLAPIVRTWVEHGHTSLAEITAADIRIALPPTGANRSFAEQALRSLFATLKAHKLIFTNPTRGLRITPPEPNIPMPMNTEVIRDALNSPNPAVALAVALVAFHALTNMEIRDLKLTDLVDGRLTLGERLIPLAGPVQVRLTAWLDHRARKWPGSLNPHLFVSKKTGPRLTPVSPGYVWKSAPFSPKALREDRILQEIIVTGGDIRRICDLFGLTVETAMRYTLALNGDQPIQTRA